MLKAKAAAAVAPVDKAVEIKLAVDLRIDTETTVDPLAMPLVKAHMVVAALVAAASAKVKVNVELAMPQVEAHMVMVAARTAVRKAAAPVVVVLAAAAAAAALAAKQTSVGKRLRASSNLCKKRKYPR